MNGTSSFRVEEDDDTDKVDAVVVVVVVVAPPLADLDLVVAWMLKSSPTHPNDSSTPVNQHSIL